MEICLPTLLFCACCKHRVTEGTLNAKYICMSPKSMPLEHVRNVNFKIFHLKLFFATAPVSCHIYPTLDIFSVPNKCMVDNSGIRPRQGWRKKIKERKNRLECLTKSANSSHSLSAVRQSSFLLSFLPSLRYERASHPSHEAI